MTRHVALVGPTASGKSALALAIAQADPTFEIVSVDSMQVYRGMDIGTAKPSIAEQRLVPHHGIDLVPATYDFTLAEFQRAAQAAVADIEGRGRRALLVGGTGLYLQSVVDRLELPGQYPAARAEAEANPDTSDLYDRLVASDPQAAARMERSNRRRIVRALEVTLGSGRPFSSFGPGVNAFPDTDFLLLGIWLPRGVGAGRIGCRVRQMVDDGWIEECRELLNNGGVSKTANQALGYAEMFACARGTMAVDEALVAVTSRTIAFARRQRVWFRRDPRILWSGAAADTATLLPGLLRQCHSATVAPGGDVS